MSFTTTGTMASPALRAARQRRSPAMISKTSPTRRATMGWAGLLADQFGKFDQLDVAERLARVVAARVQLVDRQQPLLAMGGEPRLGLRRLADERGKAAAQTAFWMGIGMGAPRYEDIEHRWLGLAVGTGDEPAGAYVRAR